MCYSNQRRIAQQLETLIFSIFQVRKESSMNSCPTTFLEAYVARKFHHLDNVVSTFEKQDSKITSIYFTFIITHLALMSQINTKKTEKSNRSNKAKNTAWQLQQHYKCQSCTVDRDYQHRFLQVDTFLKISSRVQ